MPGGAPLEADDCREGRDVPGTTKYPATGLDSHTGSDPYGFQEVWNFLATTVNGTVNTGDGSIAVASTTGFPTRGLVSIDTEVVAYTGKTSTTFTGCTRGYDGTVAASHTNGATVAIVPTAAMHNDLAAAIVALETKLGILGSTPTARAVLGGGANAGESQWLQQLVLALQAAPAAPGAGGALLYPDSLGVWRALAGASSVASVVGPDDPPLLHNGGGEVWQRGSPVAVAASTSTTSGYGPDRWCVATGANQACTITRAAGLTADSQYAMQVQRNSGQTGTGVLVYEQALETIEVAKYRGRPVSVRFDAKAGANYSPAGGNLTVAVRCGTGAESRRGGGFASETVLLSSTLQLTTTPTGYSAVGTVNVPANATQMSVAFEMTPVGAAGADDSFHVDNVTLSSGSIPHPYRPRPYGQELQLCQRYLYRFGGDGVVRTIVGARAGSATRSFFWQSLPDMMRASPSISHNITGNAGGPATGTQIATYFLGTTNNYGTGGFASLSDYASGPQLLVLDFNTSTSQGGTAGEPQIIQTGPQAYVQASAEV